MSKYEEYVGEVEFSKPTDELLEVIRRRQQERGLSVDRKTLLEIAKVVLESRV